MTIAHNHPPRCCCGPDNLPGHCPACPEHGALTATDECTCGTPGLTYAGPERDCPIHGECPSCHQPTGRPHTDYCRNPDRCQCDPTGSGPHLTGCPLNIVRLTNGPRDLVTWLRPTREPDPPLCIRCLHTIHPGECPACYCSHH